MMMGETEDYSDTMTDSDAVGLLPSYMMDEFILNTQYNFNIMVPSYIYDSLKDPDSEVRSISDKYNLAGILYEVVRY
jgi:hypothetical protein